MIVQKICIWDALDIQTLQRTIEIVNYPHTYTYTLHIITNISFLSFLCRKVEQKVDLRESIKRRTILD